MRMAIGLGGAIFLALVVVIAVKLSDDFLPAKHLDATKSAYFLDASGRARLVLVVLHVAPDGTPQPNVLPPQGEGEDVVVELYTATRPRTAPEHDGTVALDMVVPRADHLTVLDRRWGHAEHPEGVRLALQDKPPTEWTPPVDRP